MNNINARLGEIAERVGESTCCYRKDDYDYLLRLLNSALPVIEAAIEHKCPHVFTGCDICRALTAFHQEAAK